MGDRRTPGSGPEGDFGQDGGELLVLGPGELLAAAIDRTVTILDVAGGSRQELETPSAVSALAFSPDGRRLAAGAEDGRLEVWLLRPSRPDGVRSPAALRLTRPEAAAIRLLRAGLPHDELERLRAEDHPAVVLIPAALIGFPQQAAALLEGFIAAPDPAPRTFQELIQAHARPPAPANGRRRHPARTHDRPLWQGLHAAVTQIAGTRGFPVDLAVYRHWAPQVARFSFRTGHFV